MLPVSLVFKRWGRWIRNSIERRLEGKDKAIREDGEKSALMKVILCGENECMVLRATITLSKVGLF